MHKFTACFISVFALMLATEAFAAEGEMTLQQAVGSGLLQNPEYGAAAQDSLAAKEAFSQTRALYLPSVDLAGESGRERTASPFINDQKLWRNRVSVTLTQLLFDGGGTVSQINQQKARAESSTDRAGSVAEFTGLDIVEAYLDVLRQRELLALAHTNVHDHMNILDKIKAGAKGGTMTQGDVAQIEARLAQARATVASTEEDLRVAESLFAQKTGDMPGALASPETPRGKIAANVEAAIQSAMAHSPTLAAAEAEMRAAEAAYQGSSSGLYPRVNVEANSSIGNNISGVEGNDNSQSVLAVMKWNLYRGGADKARQREFLYRRAGTKDRRDQTARQIEKNMRDTWAGMVSAGARAREFHDQEKANERVVGVYLDQFSIARRTLLDVLNAQNELFSARANTLNALYAEKFAVFRILALQGDLLGALDVPRPREAMLQH